MAAHGAGGALNQAGGGGVLKRGGEIGPARLQPPGPARFFDLPAHRALQAGKGEIAMIAPGEGPGQSERAGVALSGQALDPGAAGEGEVEQAGGLVEGLAQRVVAGLAPEADRARRQNAGQKRVTARNQQKKIGKRAGGAKSGAERMGLQMIDRAKGEVMGERQRLGADQPGDQPADQTRPGGDRDGGQIGEIAPGVLHGAGDHPVQMEAVGAGGEFGDDAAIGLMFRLRADYVGENLRASRPAPAHDRGGGFIAAALDSQNGQHAARGLGRRVLGFFGQGSWGDLKGWGFSAFRAGSGASISGRKRFSSSGFSDACLMPAAPRRSLPDILRIGVRTSRLARRQGEAAARALARLGIRAELVGVRTRGDWGEGGANRPLAELGGRELFVREIEAELLRGGLDLAVHSAKDLPAQQPEGLIADCLLPRAAAGDALVARGGVRRLADLPQGARVGFAGPRRRAQILHLRPDTKPILLRGNVDRRLAKIAAGEVEAALLAQAGLARLGLSARGAPCTPEEILPAAGQGALAIERRIADEALGDLLARISHGETAACLAAERGFASSFGASCHIPAAALARESGGELHLTAELLSPDGGERVRVVRRGRTGAAAQIGAAAAAAARARASRGLLEALAKFTA